MNEKGMVLPTVLVLMTVLAGLLTGTAFVLRNQAQQLTLTQDSYQVKTMVELSEKVLRERAETETMETMTVSFNQGTVTINQTAEFSYTLTGLLESGYSYEKTVSLPALEAGEDKPEEEELSEESSADLNE